MKAQYALFALFMLLLFQPEFTSAQYAPGFKTFGDFSQQEMDMEQCSFDPDAAAIVLLHEAVSDYDDSYRLITRHHIRIKILKEKGISNADVSIDFYRKNDFEYIRINKAATFNKGADGVFTADKVDRKSIYTRDINEAYGETVFTFPSVKKGSILEYEYESNMKSYGGLEDWYFQERRPVLSSKYTLVVVPNTEFTYSLVKIPSMPAVVTPNASNGSVYFEMNNIPSLGDEPYMGSRNDYLQKVVFQLSAYGRGNGYGTKYMTSWEEVARELSGDPNFGGVVNKSVPGTDEFLKQTALLTSPEEKMIKILNFVRGNMTWNHMTSRYAADGLKSPWQKKTGNSGEINFILISLLKDAGLEVYPMLVSERWNGNVNTSYPFIDQFNKVIACVKINGKNYYLDATDKYTPPHIVPYAYLNTTGFIVHKKNGELVNIADEKVTYTEGILNKLTVMEDGTVEGTVNVSSGAYARVSKVKDYTEDKSAFLNDYYRKQPLTIEVKNFEVKNTDNDSLSFEQDCSFSTRLGEAGNYKFLPLNLFSGYTKNPFISSNRFSDINFGYRKMVTVNTDIVLPKGLVAEELPKDVKLVSPEKDIVMVRAVVYNKEENKISATIRIEFSRSMYGAEQYELLQNFYKKMFEYLEEPVLLKTRK